MIARRNSGELLGRLAALGIATLALVASGCGARYLLSPRRHATVWTRSSAEYVATTIQTYASAEEALTAALADPTWTASLDQRGDFAGLAPAVVVDLDETLLDNTPFHSMLDEKGLPFDDGRWRDWVDEARAAAIPGAVQFVVSAYARGVEVYYVTNRDHAQEVATRENLREIGAPLNPEFDTVLTRYERPDWLDDKSTRRAFVARSHRILLLVGDALGDFVAVDESSAELRREAAFQYRAMWGHKWFVLPNPIYGGWERGIR